MGAHPYWYYTDYESDLSLALEKLRNREFQAGRYNPAIPFLDFPITENSPAPGAKHSSIEAALEASDADGTSSILDILCISDQPYPLVKDKLTGEVNFEILATVFNTAFPLRSEELLALFGTEKPTHEIIESTIFGNSGNDATSDFWDIDRGTARYIIVYQENQPREIFLIGYSFD
jgi:hypothetical protein